MIDRKDGNLKIWIVISIIIMTLISIVSFIVLKGQPDSTREIIRTYSAINKTKSITTPNGDMILLWDNMRQIQAMLYHPHENKFDPIASISPSDIDTWDATLLKNRNIIMAYRMTTSSSTVKIIELDRYSQVINQTTQSIPEYLVNASGNLDFKLLSDESGGFWFLCNGGYIYAEGNNLSINTSKGASLSIDTIDECYPMPNPLGGFYLFWNRNSSVWCAEINASGLVSASRILIPNRTLAFSDSTIVSDQPIRLGLTEQTIDSNRSFDIMLVTLGNPPIVIPTNFTLTINSFSISPPKITGMSNKNGELWLCWVKDNIEIWSMVIDRNATTVQSPRNIIKTRSDLPHSNYYAWGAKSISFDNNGTPYIIWSEEAWSGDKIDFNLLLFTKLDAPQSRSVDILIMPLLLFICLGIVIELIISWLLLIRNAGPPNVK